MSSMVRPGRYVIAVSGGVDSMVLLDMLQRQEDVHLVVAHFDHGIRPDSADDASLVRQRAADYGLPYVSERVELGAHASEDVARKARYDFLLRTQEANDCQAIITAHHQDDMLETAVFNLMRGTGRRGMASLQSTKMIVRPLLDQPKSALLEYALKQKLSWHEDTTNYDERYARNYIRHRLLVKLDDTSRQRLLTLITEAAARNTVIDQALQAVVARHSHSHELDRRWFCSLEHDVAKECLASWLRTLGIADYSRKTLERLVVQLKVRAQGTVLDVKHGHSLILGPRTVVYKPKLRVSR